MDGDIEERGIDRCARGKLGTLLTDPCADTHQGTSGILHNGAHIREVDVDDARLRDDVGDAFDGLLQDIVAHCEGVPDAGLAANDREELVVGNDDESVNGFAQLCEALFGESCALCSFKTKGSRDNADRQRAELACEFGDDRCCARARASTHSTGNENHVGTFERLLHLFARLIGRLLAEVGVHARA